MLGIIIAVICSNWVGEAIHSDGIYETDLEADGSVIFLRPSPPAALAAKSAADMASRAVWCFREVRGRMGSWSAPPCPRHPPAK
jgi:chloride channel 7